MLKVMYRIGYTSRFKKDFKRCKKRGLDISILEEAIEFLRLNGHLPQEYKPHKLTGNYTGCWECHLQADWLLVWMQNDRELVLLFTNTGSHSDLF
jgi:mRNA interferase YafQ